MTKQLLAGVAVIALMTGAAVAQSVTETTTSRTTVAPLTVETLPPPAAPGTTTTKTERSVAPDGSRVESQQTIKNDPYGSVSSSETKVMRPDGSSESSWRKEWSGAPPTVIVPPPATSTTTTTTTIKR